MVNITRPTTVKRVVHNLNVSRSGVEINKIIPISKITRPGPLKKVSGLQRATEKYKNYQVIKKDNVTEFRAPKTVQYLHSYDKDAPTGTKKSYDVYSPKSVFVNKSGNVIKEVERGVQKFDVGGGSIGKIYDARVVDYGNVDGYKTKEEQTFRTQENKIYHIKQIIM